MFPVFSRIVSVIFVAMLFSFTLAGVSRADDLFTLAASRMRLKNYSGAYAAAEKCAVSPRRNFLLGVAALRLGRGDEAAPLLAAAAKDLPLAADYAALYEAEALMKQKRYAEAVAKGMAVAKNYPGTLLVRRAEKLAADSLFGGGDYQGALRMYQDFVERYAAGGDTVDALFQSARCREESGDKKGAAQLFRSIWLNNPTSSQAKQAQERLSTLEKNGVKVVGYTPEELLRRASLLSTLNEYSAALKSLSAIPVDGQAAGFVSRVAFRTGMAHYRLKNYALAEKSFLQASVDPAALSPESTFWRARSLERQDKNEQAAVLYGELADKGKKHEFADDALSQLAGMRKGSGNYTEAAGLFEKLAKSFPESKLAPRAVWESAWCRYLAGNYAEAAEAFKAQLKDDELREKALYWLARSLENSANAEAERYYRQLADEYPTGFYSTWRRDQLRIPDPRPSLGARNALEELPVLPGFEKPRLLAALGLAEEARGEMTVARKKAGEKKGTFPGVARIYQEIGDYSSAIHLFLKNRPLTWETANLPLWTTGYPVAFREQVRQQAEANALSEALVFALIRAESRFAPSVKSGAGAIGLMQLMPATAKQTAKEKGYFDPRRLLSPECNLMLGTRHLRGLLKGFDGDVVYSIAAYNAGSAAVERWKKSFGGMKQDEFIENIPYKETREYVKQVYAAAAVYRQLYGIQ